MRSLKFDGESEQQCMLSQQRRKQGILAVQASRYHLSWRLGIELTSRPSKEFGELRMEAKESQR